MQDRLEQLAKLFEKLPGIGSRQAKRFAYFVMTQPTDYVNSLASTLKEARSQARICDSCLRVFEGNSKLCSICGDESRDHNVVAVVEKSQDIDAFGKIDYQGVFFVLGGLIPIVQKNVLAGTNIATLVERVKNKNTFHEIILAFPVTPNGEHTDQVIREMLAPHAVTFEISSLGRGLSTGTELEYADPASLSASLKKRE